MDESTEETWESRWPYWRDSKRNGFREHLPSKKGLIRGDCLMSSISHSLKQFLGKVPASGRGSAGIRNMNRCLLK